MINGYFVNILYQLSILLNVKNSYKIFIFCYFIFCIRLFIQIFSVVCFTTLLRHSSIKLYQSMRQFEI